MDIKSISSSLYLKDDGIWYSDVDENIYYPSHGNESCFDFEEKSFWFKHRNNCILSVIEAFPPEHDSAFFDIGGGNGFVSSGLEKAGLNVVLLEPGQSGARNAKRRGIQNVVCGTIKSSGFKPGSIAAAGLFDVVEHIEDDAGFIESINTFMKDNAMLYITVPSYSFLWSHEDDFACHFRRYTLDSISEVLFKAGFSIEFSSYIFRILPIPIFLFRSLPYKLKFSNNKEKNHEADHNVKNSKLNSLLEFFLKGEVNNLRNKKKMVLGGSCLIAARKIRSD